jgi:Sulfotransferase domain
MLRLVPMTRHWVEMTDRLVWDGIFGGRFPDRDHAVAVFERHIEHVRATCPPERLLVFDVAEGWEPLCAFLDVPALRHRFPRLNDANVSRRVIAAVRWGTRAAPIVVGSVAAGGLAVRRRTGRRNA